MKTKVLITGVAGFGGSHLLEHLLINTDWEFIGIASWKHKGTPERIDEVLKGHSEWKERLTIITHDLESPLTEMTKKRIGKVDVILNLAADSHVDRSISDPVPFIQNNVNVMTTMLEAAKDLLKPRLKPHTDIVEGTVYERIGYEGVFLQFSTDEVYGVAPIGVNHKEWSSIVPSNPYSASKACQEALAISYWRTYGIPLIITNTMNLTGQTQDPEKYIAQLIRKIAKGETVTVHGTPNDIGSRFYLHARNAAAAILFILTNLPPKLYDEVKNLLPDRYNIVGDIELNNLEIAQMVARLMGKELKYEFVDFHKNRPGHDRRYALDGSKLRSLGWKEPVGFEESLRTTIDWTLKNPRWL